MALCEGEMKRRKGNDKDERRRGNMVKKKKDREKKWRMRVQGENQQNS